MTKKYEDTYKLAKENTISELIISGKSFVNGISDTYGNIESRVSEFSGDRQLIRKSYFISVELIENVLKYGIFSESFKNKFLLGYDNKRFYFSSGNLVDNEDVYFIEEKLKEINLIFDQDNAREQLRKMYKDKLKEAGLFKDGVKIGIIDLARKLDDKILYNFEKIDDKHSVFSIICTVDDKS